MIVVEGPLDLRGLLLLSLILWRMVHHVRLGVGIVAMRGSSSGGYLDIRAWEVEGVNIHRKWHVCLVHRRPSTRRHVDDRVPSSRYT
jgi:hypothetical protein